MEKNFNTFPQLNTLLFSIVSLFLLMCLTSCSEDSGGNHSTPVTPIIAKKNLDSGLSILEQTTLQKSPDSLPEKAPNNDDNKSLGDWNSIIKKGLLRIIVPNTFLQNELITRNSLSFNNELKHIINFSEIHNLTPILITVPNFSNMLPLLEQGLGDVVLANLTITQSRKEKVNFTHPVSYTTEQLVVAKYFEKKISLNQLDGMKIGVSPNTSFWETLTAIQKKQGKLEIIELDDKISLDEKLNIIISGEIDAIIEHSNRLELITDYRKDVKVAMDLSKERPIAWAVRKNNPDLLKHLNRHISTEKLQQRLTDIHLGDLDSIKEHRQLRLITRNNASTYFLWKNELMGFEYELMKKFSQQQKINLKVLVANDFNQMIEWLEHGYGDVISAGLIKTAERSKFPIQFTIPYLYVQQVIVQRKNDKPIESTLELHQRTFHVRKSSSYWDTLKKIQNQMNSRGIHFTVKTVPETMETEEIIKFVIEGKFDLTLADSHIIAIEKSWQSDLQATLPLSGEQGHRWLVRKTDVKLLSELNEYIKKQYKGLFYNVTYNKYFENSRSLFNADRRQSNDNRISPYDDLIKSLAKEYHFDWRLIAAQINKESRFNTNAKSWAGAMGLLQVMPRTAREVGIANLSVPENGLRAGLKYMAWINQQLSDELSGNVRTWFTLAAYNAGLGHLKDARNLAEQLGLNPDRWFGHVEKTFLLLSKPQYHKKSRYGYVRGIEPVSYVKQIQALYELYSKKHPEEV